MRNLFILCITQILFFSSSFAQGSNGLVGHWNFNGSANDMSGNGLNGMVTGTAHAKGYSGLDSTAYYFNGNGDKIDILYNNVLNINHYSICALINLHDYNSSTCQVTTVLQRGHVFELGPNSNYAMTIYDNAYDNDCNVYTPGEQRMISDAHGVNPNNSSLWLNSPVIDTNQWYCLTATYDGNNVRLYIDGVLVNQVSWAATGSNGFAPSTKPMGIGYSIAGGSSFPYYLNGRIDDIRLYNRALSSAEVSQYCDSVTRIPGPQPRDSVNRDTIGSGRIPVSIQNIAFKDHFNISVTTNTIRINSPLAGFDVVVYNSIGQTVGKYGNISNRLNIEWKSYPPGIYVIQVRYKNEIFTQKLLKQ